MAKTNTAETEEKNEPGDAPLIDLNEANIKKLIARARKRGYLTYDELNDALPQDQMSSEQIEDVMSAISEMGVNIVENEEADEDGEKEEDPGVEEVDGAGETFVLEKKKETVDRTDDPVRMYLREMGAVELLSREGEIASPAVEAAANTMILCLAKASTFKRDPDGRRAQHATCAQGNPRPLGDASRAQARGHVADDDDDTIREHRARTQEKERSRSPPADED